MKRIAAVLIVAAFLGACTEVPVKEVEKCAKVVDVQMFKNYFLGVIEDPSGPEFYKILDNGHRVKISVTSYSWLKTAKKTEIGTNYCWVEYEKIR